MTNRPGRLNIMTVYEFKTTKRSETADSGGGAPKRTVNTDSLAHIQRTAGNRAIANLMSAPDPPKITDSA